MSKIAKVWAASGLMLGLLATAQADVVSTFNFEGGVPGGWQTRNFGVGSDSWHAGNLIGVSAQSGTTFSYLDVTAAPFLGGAVDAWLITQPFTFNNTSSVSFYTEGGTAGFADRVRVYLSPAFDMNGGVSQAPLLSINEALAPAGYPSTWTQYTINFSNLSGLTYGNIGFRYTIPDNAIAGDFVALDTVVIRAAPEPATSAMMALGVGALALGLRRRRGKQTD